MEQGQLINLIDVREGEEVEVGQIQGITHIPLGLLAYRMHELDKNKSYIMVCRSDACSGRATQYLESQGFDVVNMVGGMLELEGKVGYA